MTQIVLVLGSSGRFGGNAAHAFERAGWDVRRFKRGDDLPLAAKGVDVIVNGWHPPYPDWAEQVPKLTQQVIAAAQSSGATVVVPGNVYVYGKDAPEEFGPNTPHMATNPLGVVRRTMEARFRKSGVKTIVLRAGDFIDTKASGNWFDMVMAPKAMKGTFVYPGKMDVRHAWAYLPDLARAVVQLCEKRDALPQFADIAFPGFTLTGNELMQLVENATQVTQRRRRFFWPLIGMLRPVWPTARGIWEMRYLWSKPHFLSASEFDRLLPDFEMTDPAKAFAQALEFNIHPNKAVARRGAGEGGEIAA